MSELRDVTTCTEHFRTAPARLSERKASTHDPASNYGTVWNPSRSALDAIPTYYLKFRWSKASVLEVSLIDLDCTHPYISTYCCVASLSGREGPGVACMISLARSLDLGFIAEEKVEEDEEGDQFLVNLVPAAMVRYLVSVQLE